MSARTHKNRTGSPDGENLRPLLAALSAFEDLAPAVLESVASRFRAETARPGRILFREGETADSMYILEYGLLRVTARRSGRVVSLGDLHKGDACGMSALTGIPARTETVTVRSESRVWRLKTKAFQEILHEHPGLALAVSRAVWRQLDGVLSTLTDPNDIHHNPGANLHTIVLDLEADRKRNRKLVLAIVRAVRDLPGRRGDLQILYDDPELALPDRLEASDLDFDPQPNERSRDSGQLIYTLQLPSAAQTSENPEALTRLMSWLQTEENHVEHILAFSFRPAGGAAGRRAATVLQSELIRNSARSVVITDLAQGRPELFAPDAPDRVRVYLLNRNDPARNAKGFADLKDHFAERFAAPILFHADSEGLPRAAASLAAVLFGMEVGLALGGGGAKCGAHIGVLQVLEEAGIPVHVLSSSSSGSVIAALWAAGYDATEIERLYTAAVLDPRWKFPQWNLPLRGYVARGKHGERFLDAMIGDMRTYDAVRPILPGAVDLKRGRDVTIRGALLKDAVLASQAIPGFLPLVEFDGMQLADCALANNVPASMLKDYGAALILGVNISPAPDQTDFDPTSITSNLLRSVEVMMHQTTSRHREFSDLEVRPAVGRYALTDFSQTREFIRLGREAMQNKLSALRILLARRFGAPGDAGARK
ncbi:MAG: cyclic nucleotide-binding and patatin-like phospholipase domain-containing protein [Leptospirales bacterium]|jgi:NTE family protein